MKRLTLTWFLGCVVILATLSNVQATKSQRHRREAEVAEDVHLGKVLQRTKRRDIGTSVGKSLSRVKRLDEEQELKRYKRQKRHIALIKKALAHVKKRSVSAAELKDLLRVKRTKRSAALHRVKRGKGKANQLHKKEKKSLRKRSITKRDIQLAKALLRRKRKERPQKLTFGYERTRPRTVKKDGKQKKHHVQRHKKSTNESKEKHKRSKQAQNTKSKKHATSSKTGKDLSRVKRQ